MSPSHYYSRRKNPGIEFCFYSSPSYPPPPSTHISTRTRLVFSLLVLKILILGFRDSMDYYLLLVAGKVKPKESENPRLEDRPIEIDGGSSYLGRGRMVAL